jgi:hypothetical protein
MSALQWSDVMPKTYKHLYPKICAFENLYLAHRKARRGGKRKRPEVAAFEHDLGENLLRLRKDLLAQTYRPGAYHNFIVIERKERKISAAPYRDRVVHHALINVIGPIFEARFIHDTYANREGKGTHAALDRAQYFARRHPYVLQCDVREFFPSIDHAILQGLLARHIACPLRNRNNNRGFRCVSTSLKESCQDAALLRERRTAQDDNEERFRPRIPVERRRTGAGQIQRCPGWASRPDQHRLFRPVPRAPTVRPGPIWVDGDSIANTGVKQ